MAFDFFARANAEIAVFEVGMGGRLDSTNVIVPSRRHYANRFRPREFSGTFDRGDCRGKGGNYQTGRLGGERGGKSESRDKSIRQRAEEQHARL